MASQEIIQIAIDLLRDDPRDVRDLLGLAINDCDMATSYIGSDRYETATADHCAGAILYCVAAYVMAGGKDLVADIESRAKVGL